jgi:hypothetical protein
MPEIHEGGCLCGAVRYRVIGDSMFGGAWICHCTFCKRRSGSAFGMSAYFEESAVEVSSGVLKTYEYRSDENSRWLRTEFCPNCGTTVAWRVEAFPGARGIAVGTFDDPNWIKPSGNFWTRSALHWVPFPPNVESFSKQPSNE